MILYTSEKHKQTPVIPERPSHPAVVLFSLFVPSLWPCGRVAVVAVTASWSFNRRRSETAVIPTARGRYAHCNRRPAAVTVSLALVLVLPVITNAPEQDSQLPSMITAIQIAGSGATQSDRKSHAARVVHDVSVPSSVFHLPAFEPQTRLLALVESPLAVQGIRSVT